jgi:dGTPase
LSAGAPGGSLPRVAEASFVRTRKDLEEAERSALAPYGMKSGDSRGRRHAEAPDEYRTEFQRDRDRIIHSTAFRRLIGKTQVFVSDTGDHYRTRLTHSLEVSQIARSIARSLGLNQDLTEAVALAHDLGHAPFGHSGGDALDELMKDHGGFEHNRQSLRILDYLEMQYPGVRGLNLTYEVKESILKHRRPFEGPAYADYHPGESPLLEAQLVDVADGIAYNSHDLDDGIRSGILDPAELDGVVLLADVKKEVLVRHPGLEGKALVQKIVAGVINFLVRDLLRSTAQRLQDLGIRSVEDVRRTRPVLVALSPEVLKAEAGLRRWLFENFYTHERVSGMRHRSKVFLAALFEAFVNEPQLLPQRFRELAKADGIHRAAADYIAGMTDGYAQRIYRRLFDPRHEEP